MINYNIDLRNENKLLFIIRYALPIFILIISIFATIFLYTQNKSDFEKIKNDIEEKFIYNKKLIIKEQVENIYSQIVTKQTTTEKNLKKFLSEKVYEAHSITLSIYNEYKDIYTKDEITNILRTVLKGFRFNDSRGYFFISDKQGVNIIHTLIPSSEGINFLNYKNSKGEYSIKKALKLLENNDEVYDTWYWQKYKNSPKEYKKIGLRKNIYELGWYIGTGEYVDDFTAMVKKNILEELNIRKFENINKYFIVVNENNKYIKHKNSNFIGKSVFEIIKKYNANINIKDIRTISKNGGYINIKFPKINTSIPKEKIIYTKLIPKWDWIISTGFYMNDIQVLIDNEKEKLSIKYDNDLKILYLISFIVTISLLLISFLISKLIEKRFNEYKISIDQHIKKNEKQYELLSQKSKLAAMGEMIGNIAHQWRQPLSIITTASSGVKIQKEMNCLTDKTLFDSMDTISTTAEHLSNTIDDFKDFFKPDKEKTIFMLDKPIEKTFKLLAAQLNTNDVVFIKDIETLKVEGYERELIQVLLNIINNSLDAFCEDSTYKYVFINVYRENGNVIIKIKDNAGGIKGDLIKRIFEPYFTTKHKSQGTGLGLYISQEIISRHMNGIIEVQNNKFTYKNKQYTGALFKIILPLPEKN